VKPEDERHLEVGVKTQPFRGVTANLTAFQTRIDDFQAQVVNAGVGVLRGYLANAERVRVRGLEFDGNARVGERFLLYSAVTYTDGRYISFRDAPPPLEDTGGPQVKDISGSVLPGISRWAYSAGAEYAHPRAVFGRSGQLFAAGFPGSRRMVCLPVVPQSVRQRIFRAADRSAGQQRPLRRAAG
jgi:iron complex outermembrane receptor protein